MRLKAAPGEIALGLVFAAAGAFWLVSGVRMPVWEGFAPASGFLPLLYGGLLVALALAAVLGVRSASRPWSSPRSPWA
jgi:hypothetical protein